MTRYDATFFFFFFFCVCVLLFLIIGLCVGGGRDFWSLWSRHNFAVYPTRFFAITLVRISVLHHPLQDEKSRPSYMTYQAVRMAIWPRPGKTSHCI